MPQFTSFKGAVPGLIFCLFVFSTFLAFSGKVLQPILSSKDVLYTILPMPGFIPGAFSMGCDCSTNNCLITSYPLSCKNEKQTLLVTGPVEREREGARERASERETSDPFKKSFFAFSETKRNLFKKIFFFSVKFC